MQGIITIRQNFKTGSRKMNKNYFKGWYFKCSNGDKTIAFIAAYHRSNRKESASLQIITDSAVYDIPFHSLFCREKPLYVRLGNCLFSRKGIKLNIHTDEVSLRGFLKFGAFSPIRYDIMGPFRFVPFMQCRHSCISMKHFINGQVTLNNRQYRFQNGCGYIEGDRGRSFPKRYIWTQCCFKNGSLMLSVADIPMLGFHFTGIIGVVFLNGKEYRIATYLGAQIKHTGHNSVTVKQGNYQLSAKLLKNQGHPLRAPHNGKMSRTIHESVSCKAQYRFGYKGTTLLEFTSNMASFEFEYECNS